MAQAWRSAIFSPEATRSRVMHEVFVPVPRIPSHPVLRHWMRGEGDWFGCGDPYALDHPHPGTVRARPVRFRDEVAFPLAGLDDSTAVARFPSQFFERRGGKAVCVAGASVADLFSIKRDGYLKARRMFR